MIQTFADVQDAMARNGLNRNQMEVGLTVLSGQVFKLWWAQDHDRRYGGLSGTQKALFNAIFALSIDEFKGLCALNEKSEKPRSKAGSGANTGKSR